MRNLVLVLGDQLDRHSTAFQEFDGDVDSVWMAEVEEEASHVWCHKMRLAYFFSAMRHFRTELQSSGYRVHYHALTQLRSEDSGRSFRDVLIRDVRRLRPERLIVVEPGDYRVEEQLKSAAERTGLDLEIRPDRHFYCSREEFSDYASGRRSLVMEYFYREMRRRHGVLVDPEGKPERGQWNYDEENRKSFGRHGPRNLPQRTSHRVDSITREVLELVEKRFHTHPGRLEHFNLPVTRRQALIALRRFIADSLPDFGRWEDAMWTDEPFLYHSRLSAPLNLKLLNPRECVNAAVAAYQRRAAPLNSVEGFVRQILGWREFVRGIYWMQMPDYSRRNFLNHQAKLPPFFWDGETEMQCVRQSMQHVLNFGYSHHIHRLMVLGNLALLLGVHPYAFHEWHMAMYVDAVDWVSLPNTLGMSQFSDGGVIGTKPYCSTGNYIDGMSDFCGNCPYDFRKRVGESACPFTTLYWDFLARQESKLQDNPRMKFAMKNLARLREQGKLEPIRNQARSLKNSWLK